MAPKGRPFGSKNIKTEQWEEFATFMLTAGLEKFRKEVLTLEGKQYCDVILNAMEYHKPKLSRGVMLNDQGQEILFPTEQALKILTGINDSNRTRPSNPIVSESKTA